MSYRTFYALTREPFSSDLDLKDILQTQELLGVVIYSDNGESKGCYICRVMQPMV